MDAAWTELHVGIRMHDELRGVIFSDYSFGVGVPFFTTDKDGASALGNNATHVLGHAEYSSCVVATYEADAYPRLQTKDPCPAALPGLCMRKLARGYGYGRLHSR